MAPPSDGSVSPVLDDAPLGLDFDLPEKVWVMIDRQGRVYTSFAFSGQLVVACVSLDDVWACAMEQVVRKPELRQAKPFEIETNALLAKLHSSDGVVLVDKDGKEIARRYVR